MVTSTNSRLQRALYFVVFLCHIVHDKSEEVPSLHFEHVLYQEVAFFFQVQDGEQYMEQLIMHEVVPLIFYYQMFGNGEKIVELQRSAQSHHQLRLQLDANQLTNELEYQ